ncbi:MAG: hypothetical protein KAT14_07720 [Candidatus Marinimicrobia bacterium]|nr:hypothetical protein [Candidatus Neomarinimicrobiota bacterium]
MIKNNRILFSLVIIGIIFLLQGCWIPEDFETTIKVNKDGSYTFTYDGTLTHFLVLAAAKDGTLKEEDEADMKEQETAFKKEPGYKKVKYLGEGRYKVLVDTTGKAGETYYFMSSDIKFFAIDPQDDGTLRISTATAKKEEIEEIKKIDVNISGTLTVIVEQGAKVLKHNAKKKKKVKKAYTEYIWKIEFFDTEPLIIIKPTP